MPLSLHTPLAPMEALAVADIPAGDQWQYEPKWDGFRCLAFRDGSDVQLQSKSGQPLARYFPEVVAALLDLKAREFVLDGELVVPQGRAFSFDALLQRVHPAASRVRKLAAETPALLIVFDLLADEHGQSLLEKPLRDRRPLLQEFSARYFHDRVRTRLSPATTELQDAHGWLEDVGATLDGIIAKRLDLPYRSGERTGMQKVKNYRSADCVIGGFRYAQGKQQVGSLLLGLYESDGLLHHVGFSSGIKSKERAALTAKLEALVEAPGFTGRAPGGPSRWASGKSVEWQPLRPELVVEVSYDHFTGGRFRHGTSVLRWRPDKAPAQCTIDQIHQPTGDLMRLLP
ncbi:MAG TPA: ATP-dependent DNA ligase [Chthoniobacteraceae bacterium]|nr:ATP-dependent DNA ligase [Chthoniobacteraceae bacterium]